MAFEIIEKNRDEKSFVLAGIRGSGEVVAKNVQKYLGEFDGIKTELITVSLDKKKPLEVSLSKSIDFNDKVIIVKIYGFTQANL